MPLVAPPSYAVPMKYVAIDPGTNFLGFTVFTIDPIQLEILKIEPSSIVVEYFEEPPAYNSSNYSERFFKLIKIRNEFYRRLCHYAPSAVVCEAPFYNRLRPAAYAPLVEVIQTLKLASLDYHPNLYFYTVEPSVIKKAVGAGHIAGKDEIKAVLLQKEYLHQKSTVPLHLLDEHALDSIAIGLTYLQWLAKG